MGKPEHEGTETFRAAVNGRGINGFQIMLVLTALTVLVIDGVDLQLLSLVAPAILEEWSLERSQFGLALSAALIGMSAGAFAGGTLGDRFGRRTILLVSTLLFGTATVVAGTSSDLTMLTTLRLISGLGFGAAAPNAIALVTDWLPDRVRPQITSLLSIGTPAGGMVGAAIVMAILPYTGWRGAFYACGILTLLLLGAILLFMSESPPFHFAKGRVQRAAAVVRRRLGIDLPEIKENVVLHAQMVAPAGIGFLDQSLRRLNIGNALGFFALSAVSYAFIAWTPILFTSAGFAVQQAIRAALMFNLAAVVAALATGFIIARFGSRIVLRAASLMLIAALILLGLALQSALPTTSLTIGISTGLVGVSGGFAGCGMATLYTIMTSGYPPSCRASGLGFGLMMGRIGGIVAAYFGGYLLDLGEGGPWPFIATLIICAGAGALSSAISDRHVPARALASR